MSGALKTLALLAVIAFAALVGLFVLGKLPREMLAEDSLKLLALLGLAALTVLVATALMKPRR